MKSRGARWALVVRRWPLILAYVTAFVFAIGSVQYANFVDTQSNQRWCQLLSVLDGAYKTAPPRTETGKIVAAEVHRLVNEFKCEENPDG